MRKYQLKLADRQCRMSALSLEIQNAVTMLVTALYAGSQQDPITRAAADAACRELKRRITGGHPDDADYRQVTELGATIAEQGWDELRGMETVGILQPYN